MNANAYLDLKPNRNIPDFRPGDTVRVHAKVVEGDRERIQAFEGVVIRVRRGGANSSFTVRRVSHGVGVERVFPYYSPLVDKVEVVRVGRVRRAKLYYLRERVGKAARIRAGSRARFEDLAAQLLAAQGAAPDEDEDVVMTEEEAAAAVESAEEAAVEAADDQVPPADDTIEAVEEAQPVAAEATDVEAEAEQPEAAEPEAGEPETAEAGPAEEEAPAEENPEPAADEDKPAG